MAAKSKKEEFKILAEKHQNGKIICKTELDQDRLNRLAVGTPVIIRVIKDPRNYKHHKKFFKLISEAFPYWNPEFKTISDSEQWIADTYQKYVSDFMNENLTDENSKNAINDMLIFFKDKALKAIKEKREKNLDYEGMKTIEGFLEHIMIKAECYDLIPLPYGGTIKRRWSIAFENMPQAVFNDVYKRCFGVIWNEILSDVFASQEDLENRLNMLLTFE